MADSIPKFLLNAGAGFSAIFLAWMVGEEFWPLRDMVLDHDKRMAVHDDQIKALIYSDRQTRKDINKLFMGRLSKSSENINNLQRTGDVDIGSGLRCATSSGISGNSHYGPVYLCVACDSSGAYTDIFEVSRIFDAGINDMLLHPGGGHRRLLGNDIDRPINYSDAASNLCVSKEEA